MPACLPWTISLEHVIVGVQLLPISAILAAMDFGEMENEISLSFK